MSELKKKRAEQVQNALDTTLSDNEDHDQDDISGYRLFDVLFYRTGHVIVPPVSAYWRSWRSSA